MIAPKLPQTTKIPLNIVGSSKFGRYKKISNEKTFNMFESDGWMVPTPGYLKILEIEPLAEGRGIFTSTRGNFMLQVIGDGIWIVNDEIEKIGREIPIGDITENIAARIGNIDTFTGNVYIDENGAEQIGICDQKDIYIYDYKNNLFQKASIDFRPGFIRHQDGRFLASDLDRPQWRLSDVNNGLSWPAGAQNVGEFQTKADNPRAVIPIPGKGNHALVIGSIVSELWNDVGYRLFPYEKTTSFNIDYGCVNPATIATGDNFVVWLARSEKSSPIILVSDGGAPRQISTDGINFALSDLKFPEDSYGFLWKSYGHLFYQLTFTKDKITYLYDFNSNKFYFLTDENTDNHIAKAITFFANDYYFISLIDGNLYRLRSDIDTYDGKVIPRIRILNTMRLKTGKPFIGRELYFTLEQGENSGINALDMSISYNGGSSFSGFVRKDLNVKGKRRNRISQFSLGRANEMTLQFRFWGYGRFVCADGEVEIYS